MFEVLAASMSAVGYTLLTLLVSKLPLAVTPLLTFVFSHQAGWIVNALATFIALEGHAVLSLPCHLLLPAGGLAAKWKFGSVVTPTVTHSGKRALFDTQAGYVAEALFYVLLGAASFGWNSVLGWPLALAGLLFTIIAKPWIQ